MSDVPAYSLGQIAQLLASDTAFDGMPREQALRIVEVMSLREYAQGENLIQEGEANNGQLMLIVSGEAKITSKLVNDIDTVVYRRAKPGHLVGEVGFIDEQPHCATCTALNTMHVAALERDHLAMLLEHQPLAAAQLMAGLLKIMAQRIRHANMTMQTLGIVHQGLQQEIAKLRKSATSS